MLGEGGADYHEARTALLAQHDAAEPPGAAVEALHLIHAVLSGLGSSSGGHDDGPADGDEADGAEAGEAERSSRLLAALVVLRHLRTELTSWEPRLIAAAREAGVSWASLAAALGVTSRQAAERRYLRLRPSVTGEVTGEERVQAERARRAGDRAVARWARQNSASLRRLAGQISALEDLTASARHQADRVQQALADNDAAALLSPLAAAHDHLLSSHATLAEQISTITEHTEQLRRDTRDRRNQLRDSEASDQLANHR